jgi:RNA polymerase sigma-70 factor, ECF subfamily
VAALTQTHPLLTPATMAEPLANAGSLESSTATLTSGLVARDEAAYREFHATYFDRLLRYNLVLARGDENAAQEALQETLLRVVRHARRFDEEEIFWCWLTVLARSAAADIGRKQNRYWRLLASYASSLIGFSNATTSTDADAQLQMLLGTSLIELPPEERALIEGKYLRRASVRELASENGLTEKAVESRLLRARRLLREKILTKLRHEN